MKPEVMASHHPSEIESYATDSVASSPRSDIHHHHDPHTRVRFMCSFGGKIAPRPHDNQLRYVGGETRIVAVHRATNFSSLLTKLSKLFGTSDVIVKYQLPNEDLDALISVTTDEDVENMMDEYDRALLQNHNPKSTRLRLFLFPKGGGEEYSRTTTASITSLLHGSANRDNWFIDALNSGGAPSSAAAAALERNRSEASSIVSEVPDCLFGLDNFDDPHPKSKTRSVVLENVSVSDPGSPVPVVASPFCSTVQTIPNLPPLKTKPDNPTPIVEPNENQIDAIPDIPGLIPGTQPVMHYVAGPNYPGQPIQPVPVYYVASHVPHGHVTSVPLQHVPMRAQYVQVRQPPVGTGQTPIGYHYPGQEYGGGLRTATSLDPRDVSPRIVSVTVPDGVGQHVVYGVRNSAHQVSAYPGMVVSAGDDLRGSGADMKTGKVSNSS